MTLLARVVGQAVYIEWQNPDCDWHHYRVYGVGDGWIELAGMPDERGVANRSHFFVPLHSIGTIELMEHKWASEQKEEHRADKTGEPDPV